MKVKSLILIFCLLVIVNIFFYEGYKKLKATHTTQVSAADSCDPDGGPNGPGGGGSGGSGGSGTPNSPGKVDQYGDVVYDLDFGQDTSSKVDNCGGTSAVYSRSFPALPYDAQATFTGEVDDVLLWNGKVVNAGTGIVDCTGKTCQSGLEGGTYSAPVKKGETLTIGVADTYGVSAALKGKVVFTRQQCGTNTHNGEPYFAYRRNYNEYTFTGNTFCKTGTPSPENPLFPEQGQTVTWTCPTNNPTAPISCSATRRKLKPFIGSGTVTSFGGANDPTITDTEIGSVTGVNLRSLSPTALYAAYPIDGHLDIYQQTNPDKIKDENFNYLLKGKTLRVTNPTNGKSLDLPIIDRGPYDSTRIDISPYALSQLGLDNNVSIVNAELIQ